MSRSWAALRIVAPGLDDPPAADDLVPALLDDFSPLAIEDLVERPLPPGGLWDPTFPPVPEPAPAPLHWRVFFADAETRDRAAAALALAFPSLALETLDIEDEDWAARSQSTLTAVRAGRFIVAPPWDVPDTEAGTTLIIIEPSMGFGTGHHQTTRLCLRLLSGLDLTGKDVLDLGTGSGVLAMAGAMRGARAVEAVDIDADAIGSAKASAALNPLPSTLRFRVADFRAEPVEAADLVLANLTGGMLRSSALDVAALVRPGGTLILSGFDGDEVDGVAKAFGGFVERERLAEDTWRALRLTRP